MSRSYDPNRTYHSSPNVYAMKSLTTQHWPTPSWLWLFPCCFRRVPWHACIHTYKLISLPLNSDDWTVICINKGLIQNKTANFIDDNRKTISMICFSSSNSSVEGRVSSSLPRTDRSAVYESVSRRSVAVPPLRRSPSPLLLWLIDISSSIKLFPTLRLFSNQRRSIVICHSDHLSTYVNVFRNVARPKFPSIAREFR